MPVPAGTVAKVFVGGDLNAVRFERCSYSVELHRDRVIRAWRDTFPVETSPDFLAPQTKSCGKQFKDDALLRREQT